VSIGIIVDYAIVAHIKEDGLVDSVKSLMGLQEGWQPLCGVSNAVDEDNLYYCQAMVKYEW
jgi:hypothetical protein